ncbi:MAG TPA: ion transporter [Xanthobacteraceae bacterium]|nr:ion transporter [Xanthobacteraceae bacterium]
MSSFNAQTLRHRLAVIFEDEEPRNALTRAVNGALALLIIANVSCVILESVEPIRRGFAAPFDIFENVSTTIFAVEYVLRVWVCVDYHVTPYRDPVWGRLRYMRSFFALVDLVSVLPSLIGFFDAADFRIVRLLRLLRMLKLVRHSTTFTLLFAVLREEGRAISALLFVLLLTVTISASLMFMLENEAQPEVFTSIPVAMWWAIETLTTVGYGDIVPATLLGRVIGGCVSIIGIGTLALFSGLITVGFLDQLKIYREQHPKAVTITKNTITVQQTYSSVVVTPDIVGSAALPSHCPHCGSVLSYPALRESGEPLGA